MNATMIRMALASALALAAPAAFAQDAAVDLTERLDNRQYFKSGQEAWEKTCARCHTAINEKQDQSVGPDLSINQYDADTIAFFVRNGQLAMPAFPESAIDNATLADLADYIAKNIYKGE